MFSFLNRNKSSSTTTNTNDLNIATKDQKNDNQILTADKNLAINGEVPNLQAEIDDAKKNLYESILHKRTDILVSIMNEWFKSNLK